LSEGNCWFSDYELKIPYCNKGLAKLSIKKLDDGIFIDPSKIDVIKKLDSAVFDCDGVLIDVSNSYDLAIKKTVDFVIKKMTNFNEDNLITTKMIEAFKESGGFNDEVDVTYALIISFVAAKKMRKPFNEFVFQVAKNADKSGIISVENFLNSLNADISDIQKKLSYPSTRFENPLNSIFDEIFYGPKLYQMLHKRKPEFYTGAGLIENDVVLINQNLMQEMHKKFGTKISIVTGRGILSAKESLKELINEFDIQNSKFLEDEPREMAKPNPQSLISSIKGMKSSCALFVGDSVEDYIMAKQANDSGIPTIFCGIYGTSKDPTKKFDLFEKKKANMILESVDLIPKTLNLVET
jgi:phosphoglycolate phosphatase-like HAD superfamily hydrolase